MKINLVQCDHCKSTCDQNKPNSAGSVRSRHISVVFNGCFVPAAATALHVAEKSSFDFCSEECLVAHFTKPSVLESALAGR